MPKKTTVKIKKGDNTYAAKKIAKNPPKKSGKPKRIKSKHDSYPEYD